MFLKSSVPSMLLHHKNLKGNIQAWRRAAAQREYQPQLTTDMLNLVRFTLIKTKLGKMGVGKIHVDVETGMIVNDDTGQEISGDDLTKQVREEMEYRGQRYNEEVVKEMFKL